MRRRDISIAGLLAVALGASPASAALLTFTKSSSVVADQVSAGNPKALPGASVDYKLLVTNTGTIVVGPSAAAVTITDTIPTMVKLRVVDIGAANSGPVEFQDGALLGSGIAASGASLVYGGLASGSDGIEFFNGTSWSYTPVPDATGCDPAVRKIRITLTGAQAAGTILQLRYRVIVQ